jgi:hypothetical protein
LYPSLISYVPNHPISRSSHSASLRYQQATETVWIQLTKRWMRQVTLVGQLITWWLGFFFGEGGCKSYIFHDSMIDFLLLLLNNGGSKTSIPFVGRWTMGVGRWTMGPLSCPLPEWRFDCVRGNVEARLRQLSKPLRVCNWHSKGHPRWCPARRWYCNFFLSCEMPPISPVQVSSFLHSRRPLCHNPDAIQRLWGFWLVRRTTRCGTWVTVLQAQRPGRNTGV